MVRITFQPSWFSILLFLFLLSFVAKIVKERERESDKVRFMIRRRAEKKVERLILSTKWGKAKEKGDV